MMLLDNLAEGSWLSISCDKELVYHMVCQSETVINKEQKITEWEYYCPLNSIAVKRKCFSFSWKSEGIDEKNIWYKHCKKIEITIFDHIFDNIILEDKVTQIIATYKCSKFYMKVFKLRKHFDVIKYTGTIRNIADAEGVYIRQLERRKILLDSFVFHCKDGGYISYNSICNNFPDCPYDTSDEEHCICSQNIYIIDIFSCSDTKNIKPFCSDLYYINISGHCNKYNNLMTMVGNFSTLLIKTAHKKNNNRLEGKVKGLDKNDKKNGCSQIVKDDLIPDCFPNAKDEPILKSLLRSQIYLSCSRPYEIPCLEGHKKCYNSFDICIYNLDEHKHLYPCRNGGHLQNCRKFECNMMYK